MLEMIVELFKGPFGGLVAGAVGTLIGGLITLRVARQQLGHDSHERARERQMTLRREVYLQAAEALGQVQEVLSAFSRQDVSVGALHDRLSGITGKLAKLHLVVSLETIRALVNYSRTMTGEVATLIPARARVELLKLQLDEAEADCLYAQSVLGRLGAIQANRLLPGSQQSSVVDAISVAQAEYSAARERRAELTRQHLMATEELTDAALNASMRTAESLPLVAVAIRRQLESPLDEAAYLKITKDAATENRKAIVNALEKTKAIVRGEMSNGVADGS